MRSSAAQMFYLAFSVIGLIGVILCCTIPEWKVTSFMGANIQTQQKIHEGLWMNCLMDITGQLHCKMYDSMLEISPDLKAARLMTILSCLLCGLSLLILFLGANFTSCVQNEDDKNKISQLAGVVLVLAGLLVIIPITGSAHSIMRDLQKELGGCIYVGWAAGVMMILAGLLAS